MRNNWSLLLDIENITNIDANVAIILNTFFNNFVYIETKKDKIIAFNQAHDLSYKIKTVRNENYIYIMVYNLEENKYNKLTYNIKIEFEELSNKIKVVANLFEIKKYYEYSNYCEKKEQFLRYVSNLEKHISSAVIETSFYNSYYDLNNNYVIPDLRCKTYIKSNKNKYDKKNIKYFDSTKVDGGFNSYESKLPICFLLIKEHNDFLYQFETEHNKTFTHLKKKNKIGF